MLIHPKRHKHILRTKKQNYGKGIGDLFKKGKDLFNKAKNSEIGKQLTPILNPLVDYGKQFLKDKGLELAGHVVDKISAKAPGLISSDNAKLIKGVAGHLVNTYVPTENAPKNLKDALKKTAVNGLVAGHNIVQKKLEAKEGDSGAKVFAKNLGSMAASIGTQHLVNKLIGEQPTAEEQEYAPEGDYDPEGEVGEGLRKRRGRPKGSGKKRKAAPKHLKSHIGRGIYYL